MRKFWCSCGSSVEAQVEFRNGAYEAEFFDEADRQPIENCPGCDEELYQMFCEGTLSDTRPERRPLQIVGGRR
jgi:hypothetical protein